MIDRKKLARMRGSKGESGYMDNRTYSEMIDTIEKLLAVKEAAERTVNRPFVEGKTGDPLYLLEIAIEDLEEALAACNEKEGGGR